jgi:AAA family ATP:ADP antiporter
VPETVDALTGLRLVAKRPYLRILCIYMVLQTICATFFYNQRGYIVDAEISDRAQRVRFFADIDFWVNAISLTFQVLFTGSLLKSIGVRPMLLALPLFAVGGFAWLASAGSLLAIKFSMIATRACEFATAKPARETLYTVVSREEKYQAKGFIDTFVYRGGDMVGAWVFHGLKLLLAQGGTAWVGVPLATGFTAAAFVLGRRQEALAQAVDARESPSTAAAPLESSERRV